jgi:hypothetical protein
MRSRTVSTGDAKSVQRTTPLRFRVRLFTGSSQVRYAVLRFEGIGRDELSRRNLPGLSKESETNRVRPTFRGNVWPVNELS